MCVCTQISNSIKYASVESGHRSSLCFKHTLLVFNWITLTFRTRKSTVRTGCRTIHHNDHERISLLLTLTIHSPIKSHSINANFRFRLLRIITMTLSHTCYGSTTNRMEEGDPSSDKNEFFSSFSVPLSFSLSLRFWRTPTDETSTQKLVLSAVFDFSMKCNSLDLQNLWCSCSHSYDHLSSTFCTAVTTWETSSDGIYT